jgi:hypothetical protein
MIGRALLALWVLQNGSGLPAVPPGIDPSRFLAAPLTVRAEDLLLRLEEGAGFLAAGDSPAVLVLVGRGTVSFAPPIGCEQREVEQFCGARVLEDRFETAYILAPLGELTAHLDRAPAAIPGPPPKLLLRAQSVFSEETTRSPAGGQLAHSDFLARIETRHRGRLTYLRLTSDPEDIQMLDSRGDRISLYPSRAHRDQFGFAYGDEYGLAYRVEHYDVDVAIEPTRRSIEGRATLRVHALDRLETAQLRLAPGLAVGGVRSAERGSHQFYRPERSDRLFVRFLPPLPAGGVSDIEVSYAGPLASQDLTEISSSGGGPSSRGPPPSNDSALLYSNRVWWYPQSPVRNHTSATLTVRLPPGSVALATGMPEEPTGRGASDAVRVFSFRTEMPVRYLSLLVANLVPAAESPVQDGPPTVRVLAVPSLSARAGALAPEISRIVSFFVSEMGDAPFPRLTAAFVQTPVPAGHSPAYLAIFGMPRVGDIARPADDPSYPPGEPSFLLAHEIAHQWWGQAVGWRNYREQWLSEAFAQYFAALYVRHAQGDAAFRRVLSWMDHWAKAAARHGAISVGLRAGRIAGDPRLFPAVVYDRGALALHMLRGFLGEEAFFAGLRAYYRRWKFERVGTDDFRTALEEASGTDLKPFFEYWVRKDEVPQLRWSQAQILEGDRRRVQIRVEQLGDPAAIPLSVLIEYFDRPSQRRLLRVGLPREQFLLDVEAPIRRLRLNEDLAALCEIRESSFRAGSSTLGQAPTLGATARIVRGSVAPRAEAGREEGPAGSREALRGLPETAGKVGEEGRAARRRLQNARTADLALEQVRLTLEEPPR